MSELTPVYGMFWSQPEQWDRLIEISEDRDELDDSYDEWRKNANRTIDHLRAKGQKIEKVEIDLEKFLFWCNGNTKLVNGSARPSMWQLY